MTRILTPFERMQEQEVKRHFDLSELQREEKVNLDCGLLCETYKTFFNDLAIMSNYFSDINLGKSEAKIPETELISLNWYDSTTFIFLGADYHKIKSKMKNAFNSPIFRIDEEFSEATGLGLDCLLVYLKNPHILRMEEVIDKKKNSEEVSSRADIIVYPSHPDLEFIIPPPSNDIGYETTHNFLSTHMFFEAKTQIAIGANLTQKGYVKGLRNMLEFFMKEKIPFAVSSYNPFNWNPHIIGGYNPNRMSPRSYRCNPKFPEDLDTKVWMSVVHEILPRY